MYIPFIITDGNMISWQDIHAIATTVGPGLAFSLNVGLNYSKNLLQQYKLVPNYSNISCIPVVIAKLSNTYVLLIQIDLIFYFIVDFLQTVELLNIL